MKGDLLLGIDTGTSVVKAALFDSRGQEVAAATRRTILRSPHPGWSETGMAETWETTAATIRELLTRADVEADRIAAVGVAGNMIGAWLIDAQGQPVRDAILWNDARTRPLLDQLSQEHSNFMSRVFNFSGSVLEFGATLPLIRWLADNEPDTLARAQYILHAKDWIRYKLTGQILTDVSEVPGTPADAPTQRYSDALFALFGLRQYRHLFPPAAPSQSVVGEILPEAAEATGLAVGTPVVAGAGDVPAVVLGVGAVMPGMACSILGTNSINGIILDQPTFEPPDMGLLFAIPEQRWMRALANVAGTTNVDWFASEFCEAAPPEALFEHVESLAEQSRPGARGVLYLPYLSEAGIIAPFVEPAARAQFFGMTRAHTKADLLRAVYEGVALATRDGYETIGAPIEEIRLSGGGARSRVWGQIIADCTGVRVVVPAGSEFGAKGAALLAGTGVGVFPSILDAADEAVRIDRVYKPDPRLKPMYDENYALFVRLRNTLREVWQHAENRKAVSIQLKTKPK